VSKRKAKAAPAATEWYVPLLQPDPQLEGGLAPSYTRDLAALRQAFAERGPFRGLMVHAAKIADINYVNFHASIRRLAERKAKLDSVRLLGTQPLPAMLPRQITRQVDKAGNLVRASIQERPAPGDAPQPGDRPGFAISKVSTYRSGDGELIGQWVQERPEDVARVESARTFVEGLLEGKPPAPLIQPPAASDDDLLCVYPMGDPHFGMRAHAPEAGENFDLTIAERQTKAVVDRLVHAAPPARHALLLNLGDFFHADDDSAQTKRSKNQLDVDGRYHRVLRVGAWTLAHLIYRLLEKHETVEVWNERGNHDDTSALVLQVALGMHFTGNPRVTVNESPAYFHFREFGRCLIGATHGDGPKEGELPGIMAHDAAESWGRTKFRTFHRGHFHHDMVKDLTGCTVETHRTLAASDAWHRKSGYRAPRDMKVITYHARFGEIARTRVNLDMIGELAAA
jgi:hypothetical protein